MTMLRFEQLAPIKLPLIKRFYKQHYPSAKAKSNEAIVVAYQNVQMVGVVRFREIEQYRLLTGMLISPECRGKGFGHQLLAHCQENYLTSTDYCFAYAHLQGLYQQHGFSCIDSTALPANLRSLFDRYSNSGKSLLAMQFVD